MSTPRSTYRLQITDAFTLADAAELTEYLVSLGVGTVYVSPLLQATSGSSHGYDVTDHDRVDTDRGGSEGLRVLADACRERGLGLVVDIVPNHMGVAKPEENAAWWDVLQHGRQAAHAHWFDIDWSYPDGKILIPVLGDGAGDDDLTLEGHELRYFEHRYPIAPGTGSGTPAQVHARQHYRLVSFRLADTEQNYRRFFAVTDLAGLRVEDETVFDATHAEILRWVTEHGVTGIRVDHPDGLVDPGGYLSRLAACAPQAWITVEKITEPGEELLADWPVAGMTGYDALAEVNNLFVDPTAEATMSELYGELTGDTRSWDEHVEAGKRLVATTILTAEIRRMARLVPEVTDAEAALTELTVAFGVYRSYLPEGCHHLDEAVARARQRRPELGGAIDALLPRLGDPDDELARRFQQATGAITAKGVEDTAYYRYTRLISLNEVGGHPGTFGSGVARFHEAQRRRQQIAPEGMTTLSTHDTKRGEDIRARIAVLAELPEVWGQAARRLLQLAPVPDAAFGYLLWQTLAATGFIARDRLHAYAEKAMREAAEGTGWIDPDESFEAAVHAAVDAAYDLPPVHAIVAELHAAVLEPGAVNSLSQKLVQLTMPGIPDVYQGSELWEESLVDPDNRRPVDFAARRALLADVDRATGDADVDRATGDGGPSRHDEAAKLLVTTRALHARTDRPELFTGYRELLVDGTAQDHAIAFDRGGAITVATRLPVALDAAGGWHDTRLTLPVGSYRDALTGRVLTGELLLSDLLATYPVALLLKEDPR